MRSSIFWFLKTGSSLEVIQTIKEMSEKVLLDLSSNSNDHVGREKRRLAIISQKLELDREHYELDTKGVNEERIELEQSMSEEKKSR